MPIVECQIPSSSVLERRLVEAASFHDSYRAPLRDPRAGIVDVFFAIFGHHPWWMKLALAVRNRIASSCGLEAATAAEIFRPLALRSSYAVGEKIGVWPIYALTAEELVAGRDNKHLDFRLSVLKELAGESASVVVSTICIVHNSFGTLYLFFILPFHRWGVRKLLSRAVAAGRL
jgi:hypothetical protein